MVAHGENGGQERPSRLVQGVEFAEGELVIANLRFQTREYNGQAFMDVIANEICKIKD